MAPEASGPERGPSGLPFDPVEWERRVAEARVRREAALASRTRSSAPPARPPAPRPVAAWTPAAGRRRSPGLPRWPAVFAAGLLVGLAVASLSWRPRDQPLEVMAALAPRPDATALPPRPLDTMAALVPLPDTAAETSEPPKRPPPPAPSAARLALVAPGAAPRAAPLVALPTPAAPARADIRFPDPATQAPAGIDPQRIRGLVETALADAPAR